MTISSSHAAGTPWVPATATTTMAKNKKTKNTDHEQRDVPAYEAVCEELDPGNDTHSDETSGGTSEDAPVQGGRFIEHREVRIADIKIGKRMRPLDDGKVEELRISIRTSGLMQPPVVDENLNLIAGHHRVEGVGREGIESITVAVWSVEADEARLMEITENLFRAELSPLERAEHIVEAEAIVKKRGGVTAFVRDIAPRLGLKERSVFDARKVGRLSKEVRDRIRGTDLAHRTRQLNEITKIADDRQLAVVDLLIGDPDLSVQAALKRLSPTPTTEPTSANSIAHPVPTPLPADTHAADERRVATRETGDIDDESETAPIADAHDDDVHGAADDEPDKPDPVGGTEPEPNDGPTKRTSVRSSPKASSVGPIEVRVRLGDGRQHYQGEFMLDGRTFVVRVPNKDASELLVLINER